MRRILLEHYKRYPKMQIQDMVKLIYQNEFAGGHFITHEKESLTFLQQEFHSLEDSLPDGEETADTAFEEIGNGLCRLHLMPLRKASIRLETVNRFFVNTANSVQGSLQSFQKKLDIFRQCCRDQALPYPLEELEAYLDAYRRQGFPHVSHSEVYRAAYSPAYRVVKSQYRDYFELFCRIDSLLGIKESVCVAIDGNSGAGKSSLATLIKEIYDCNVFHMDDFFLTPGLRTEERLKEVGGNVDYVRFRQEVIHGLRSGRAFRYRKYDCSKMAFDEPVTVTPERLNIIEGCYSMHPTLIDFYDLKVFLGVDKKEQSARILKRNGPVMHKRFLLEWIPLEDEYFEKMNIPEKCDLVLDS
ncbi:MAG: uridine kinase family protein [Clostridia bacterium]